LSCPCGKITWIERIVDEGGLLKVCRSGPKGAGYVVQYLGVELLPAEPGALVFAYDLVQKGRCQINPVVVRRAAGNYCRRIADQFAKDSNRLRRRGDNNARVITEAQPEHEHRPGFVWIPPRADFVCPRAVMLRSAKPLRLVGAVGRRNGPIGPGQAAFRRFVMRALSRQSDRKDSAFAFDHDIAGIGCRRRDQGNAAPAVIENLIPDIFRASPSFAKATSGK
jgi:hypothetical protein